MPGQYARGATSTTAIVTLPLSAAALIGLVQPPVSGAWIAYLILRMVLVAAFTLTALLLAREPMQRANAAIFAVTTVALFVGWIHVWTPTPIPLIVATASSLMWGGLAWVVLRYPRDRLDGRGSRAFVAFGFAWLSLGHAIVAATYDAQQAPSHGWPAHTWRPTLSVLFAVNHLIIGVSGAVDGVFTLVFLGLLVRRIRRTSGLDRAMSAPMFAAGFAAAVPLLNRVPAQVLGTTEAELFQAVVQKCFLLSVPIAFIVLLVRERLACATLVRVVHSGGGQRADIEKSFQTALHDPALRLLPVGSEQSARADRVQVDIDHEGGSLAVLDVDRALTLHPTLLQTALDCCVRAVELEHLRISIRGHLNDLAVARQDAADSAQSERARIERDLHDGVQQRLLALNLRLARLRLDRASADQIVAAARDELKTTTAELRDLTHGRGSAAVRRSGLADVVTGLCSALPIVTSVDVEDRRWPDGIEQAAYFVVCEGLSNVIKHAAAESAHVSIRQDGDALRVEVVDSGSGGASDASGTGLRGLRERVERLGGEVRVDSEPSMGTRLVAEIPAVMRRPSHSA